VSLFSVGSLVRIEHGKPWKRTLTMTGIVKSWSDGLLVLERTFPAGGRYDSLGDEKLAGDHGLVEIVGGSWVLRRVYFRSDGQTIGELYNIQTPVVLQPGLVRYTDLEVDVVRRADGRVEVVDEEDLASAVALGGISPALSETALAIAHRLAAILRVSGDWRDAGEAFRLSHREREFLKSRPRSGWPDARSP
jgi:probable ribonuclease FAU-1